MLGQLFSKLIGSGKYILGGIGMYTTIRYFWDDSVNLYESKIKNKKIYNEIKNIELTQDDIKKFTGKYGTLSEWEIKRLKHQELNLIKEIKKEQSSLDIDKYYDKQLHEDIKWRKKD